MLPIEQIFADTECSEIDTDEAVYVDKGVTVNSGDYDGLSYEDAFNAIADWFEENGRGRRTINYRLRDWGVSRQRYWGAPIPIINCDSCGSVPVPEQDLPVVLPTEVEFEGVGSPIKRMPSFYQTSCPACGGHARPGVVWFGEAIPEQALERSFAAAQDCDVFLSIGTSSLVYPAAGLAELAKRQRAVVAEINPGPTGLADRFDFAIPGKAGAVVRAWSLLGDAAQGDRLQAAAELRALARH